MFGVVSLAIALAGISAFEQEFRAERQSITYVQKLGGAVHKANRGLDVLPSRWKCRVVELSLADCHCNDDFEFLQHFTKLERLDLFSTTFDDFDVLSISQLRHLKSLSLAHTSVTSRIWSELSSIPSLERLDLSGSNVDTGPNNHAKFPSLRTLTLAYTSFGDAGVGELLQLVSLESLDLSNSKVGNQGVVHLQRLPSLIRLNLSGNSVNDDCLRAIGKLSNLTSIELGATSVKGQGLKYISKLQDLKSLSFANGIKPIPGAFQMTGYKTPKLNLKVNDGTPELADLLDEPHRISFSSMPMLHSLEELDLTFTDLDSNGFGSVFEQPKLRIICLAGANVNDEALASISRAQELQYIDLSDTAITDRCLKELSKLPVLRSIVLNRTGITDEGLKYLAESETLERIYLGGTAVGDTIAELVTNNPNLAYLTLAGTNVTDEILSVLSNCSQLRCVDLSWTKVSSSGCNALRRTAPWIRVIDEGVQ